MGQWANVSGAFADSLNLRHALSQRFGKTLPP